MSDYLKRFYDEAKSKVTVYIVLLISGLSQVAEHAQEILDDIPSIKPLLPTGHTIDVALHWVISALGIFAVYTRVRRKLKP